LDFEDFYKTIMLKGTIGKLSKSVLENIRSIKDNMNAKRTKFVYSIPSVNTSINPA
jgi:hypothetical protein